MRKAFDSTKWLQKINASHFTMESSEKICICLLVISKHLEWDGKKLNRFVDFGFQMKDDNNEFATKVFCLYK